MKRFPILEHFICTSTQSAHLQILHKSPAQIRPMFFSNIQKGISAFVPVEIVEERQEVESQFAPAFFLTERQDVGVHDGRWVVESWTAHHRSAHVPAPQLESQIKFVFQLIQTCRWDNGHSPPDVISQQWQVETEGEPLGRAEEHHAEEEVDEILREDQLKRVSKCHYPHFFIHSYEDKLSTQDT